MKNYLMIFMMSLIGIQAYGHVKLTAPKGAETYTAGDQVQITWEVVINHGANDWDLLFSEDGGQTWDIIISDISAQTLNYGWTVPTIKTNSARIKVVQDNTGTDYEAESGDFVINLPGISINQLLIPPIISGDDIDLQLQKGSHEFFKGSITNTLGINGDILGPTLVLNKGQDVSIKVENKIGESTTIHWHGMHVSSQNDGGPHTVIEPNEVWNPQFTVLDKAGTYWYHPHLHQKTNDHVLQGLAGFIIVRDEEEAALNLPRTYGIDDIPVVIQTKTFNNNKQIVLGNNNLDKDVLANGVIEAFVNVPAQVIRLRLLNGASQRIFNLGLSNNVPFYQIASDGGLLEKPVRLTRLMLTPGERAEILIDLTKMEAQNIFLRSYASELPQGYYGAARVGMNSRMTIPNYNDNPLNGANFDILELRVDEPNGGITTIPSQLVNLTPWSVNDVDENRSLVFAPKGFDPMNMVNGPFVINGASFDIQVINERIPLRNTEIWTITNQTMIAHPFHIHDVQFYLLSRNGQPVPENERGRKDVVIVPPMNGTVRFITKFEDFADDDVPFMYHCHMLTHEDEGMMGQFLVIDQTTSTKNNLLTGVKAYPNPAGDALMIERPFSAKVEVFNLKGERIDYRASSNNDPLFNLQNYNPGVYYFKLTQEGKTQSIKIIKH